MGGSLRSIGRRLIIKGSPSDRRQAASLWPLIGQRSHNPSPADPRPFNGFDGSGARHYGPAATAIQRAGVSLFRSHYWTRFTSIPSLVFHLVSRLSSLVSLSSISCLLSLVSRLGALSAVAVVNIETLGRRSADGSRRLRTPRCCQRRHLWGGSVKHLVLPPRTRTERSAGETHGGGGGG